MKRFILAAALILVPLLAWAQAGFNNPGPGGQITAIPVPVAQGGTGASLAATGGTSQVLQQATTGAVVTVGQLSAASLSDTATNAALTFTDQSGAALSLTTSGQSTKVGNAVNLFALITYPSTVNGSANVIRGISPSAGGTNRTGGGGLCRTGGGLTYSVFINSNGTDFSLFTTAGVQVLNATLSTVALTCNIQYPSS